MLKRYPGLLFDWGRAVIPETNERPQTLSEALRMQRGFLNDGSHQFSPWEPKVGRIPNGLFSCMERARSGQKQNAKLWSRLAIAACGLISGTLLKGGADPAMHANIFSAEQMRLAD